ncbi:ABC transporter permease [Phocaeicola faecalis]
METKDNQMMEEEKWSLVIVPKTGLFKLDLRELWRYRDLLVMYIHRDIVTFYKQTILGPLWFLIQPLFTTLMFMFVFGGIAGISTDGLPQPLFYMAGLLCWNYFAECLNRCSDTFNANQNVFGKVYFPRLIVPLSIVVSSIVKMGIQFGLFLFIYLYYIVGGYSPVLNAYAFLLPLLILILAGLGLGFGLLISSLTTKYRDLRFLVTFGVQLWMYATPVIYPLSVMQQDHRQYMWLILANPLTAVIETFKFGFLGEGTFSWWYLGYSFCFMAVVMLLGMITFNKVQRSFMDVI